MTMLLPRQSRRTSPIPTVLTNAKSLAIMPQAVQGKGRMNVAKPLAARMVRDVRMRLGLTQEKFASKLGVSFPTVSRWENGRSAPSPLAFRQLEEVVKELEEAGEDLLEKYFATTPGKG